MGLFLVVIRARARVNPLFPYRRLCLHRYGLIRGRGLFETRARAALVSQAQVFPPFVSPRQTSRQLFRR